MKKNRMLKIASAMIMLCLITTCAIGTTFAKYTTATSASDTARVAKWGVEVSASGTMFGKYYGANTAGENADRIVAAISGSVDTSSGDKVVAPGTKNDTGIQIKLAGTPEVAFKVSASGVVHSEIYLTAGEYGVMVEAYGINDATDFGAEALYTFDGTTYTKVLAGTPYNKLVKYYRLTNYVNVLNDYHPIVWTGEVHSAGTTGEATGSWAQNFATLKEAVTALSTQINTIGNTDDGIFEANETINNVYILKWVWAFENNQGLAYADAADTILGDLIASRAGVVKLAAGGGTATAPVAYDGSTPNDYCLTIVCGIEAGATQVD